MIDCKMLNLDRGSESPRAKSFLSLLLLFKTEVRSLVRDKFRRYHSRSVQY